MTDEQIKKLEERLALIKQKHAQIKATYDLYSSMILEVESEIKQLKTNYILK